MPFANTNPTVLPLIASLYALLVGSCSGNIDVQPATTWHPASDAGADTSFDASLDSSADASTPGVGAWIRVDRCPGSCSAPINSLAFEVWTGSEFLLWDGLGPQGASFDPKLGLFSSFTGQGEPTLRKDPALAPVGGRLFMWGGHSYEPDARLNDGALYDPTTDSWTALPLDGAPTPRSQALAVATGRDVLVWGGSGALGSDPGGGGGAYRLAESKWNPMATSGQPGFRVRFTGVWTGTEMIVWGGVGDGEKLNTGGRYDPMNDAWRDTSIGGAPSPRIDHTAVWTGKEMIVWGGQPKTLPNQPHVLNTGGAYDPVHDTWRATSLENAPPPRVKHVAVWTGTRMVVLGGDAELVLEEVLVGGVYDPVTDRWERTTSDGAPGAPGAPFFSACAAWDGPHQRVLVVGSGSGGIQVWAYTPPAP